MNGARMEMPTTAPPTAGPATPPSRKPDWYAPVARPLHVRVHRPQQQRHRGDSEHRRSEAAERPHEQQLQVAVREGGRQTGGGQSPAGREHLPLTEAVDPGTRTGRGDQPHEGEGTHYRPGEEGRNPETACEHWDRRCHDAKAERDAEGDRREHADLARQPGEHRVRLTSRRTCAPT